MGCNKMVITKCEDDFNYKLLLSSLIIRPLAVFLRFKETFKTTPKMLTLENLFLVSTYNLAGMSMQKLTLLGVINWIVQPKITLEIQNKTFNIKNVHIF